MKILASVRFNSGKAYVLEGIEDYKYHRIGDNIIYGTDGLRYISYKYDRPSGRFFAFGGRKFNLKIEDTCEIVDCYGQWWDGGSDIVEKELGLDLISITYNTIEELKKCYVYYGAMIDKNRFSEILKEQGELFYYDYFEYEKLIKYDDIWKKYRSNQFKFERTMKSIKKEFKKYKSFKNQKVLNYT